MFPPETLPDPCAGAEALETKGFKFEWCRQAFERAFPDYAESIPRARANYLGMLRLLDDQIKRFVEFLDHQGLRENTIIVFMSDHGDFVGDYGLLRKGAGLCEALCRIPLQIYGPGISPSDGPHPAHVSICDILPTLCEAAGLPIPAGVQGRSLWPIVTDEDYPDEEFASACVEHGFGGLDYTSEEPLDPREDGLFESTDGQPGSYDCLNSWTQSGTMRMVRKGDWKLVFDMQGEGQLYDLSCDPAELHNLYSQPEAAAKKAELLEEMLTWLMRIQDPLPLPRTRYVMKRGPHNYWTAQER
jgi:arylsulfatase A-like enzyme